MRILLTGGSGFIGKPTIKKLLSSDQQARILAITRQHNKKLPGNEHIQWIEGDLSRLSEVSCQIKKFQPEVVIHLAWNDIPNFSPIRCIQNLRQSIDFFELIWTVQSCKKIIVAGSCVEYGSKFGICRESDKTNSNDLFSWSKLSLLDYLQKKTNHKNICLGWLRIFYAYGPGQRQGSLIPFIIENLKNGELPPLKAPKNYNDYIHVNDIADLFSLSVSKEFPSGIYNVGSGKKTSVIEICKIAESVILNQQSLATALEEQSINSISDVAFYSSIKLTKSVFDWTPSTELKNGIEQTYQASIYDQ